MLQSSWVTMPCVLGQLVRSTRGALLVFPPVGFPEPPPEPDVPALQASGSPQALSGGHGHPTVQFGLHLQYPALGLEQRELQRVGIHRRPPGIAASSPPTCWPPSPCTELSSARTTTGPPPHLRPSAGNGPALLAGPAVRTRRATAGGSHVHHVPIGQVGVPLLPRQHHHAYAADLQRGLPTGSWRPASELTAPAKTSGHALHPGPISARLEPGDKTYEALHGFLFVRLLALLAEPDASGSSAPSRRCQGCFPSSTGVPQPGLPSASTRPLRRPGGRGLTPPLGHMAPRGAPSRSCGPPAPAGPGRSPASAIAGPPARTGSPLARRRLPRHPCGAPSLLGPKNRPSRCVSRGTAACGVTTCVRREDEREGVRDGA